jgi:hypothetical protein
MGMRRNVDVQFAEPEVWSGKVAREPGEPESEIKRAPPRESAVQRAVMTYLNSLPECKVRKLHGTKFGKDGEPDLYGCYRGRAFFIELKRPGGKATHLQSLALAEWARTGAITGTCTSVAEVRKLLRIEEAK